MSRHDVGSSMDVVRLFNKLFEWHTRNNLVAPDIDMICNAGLWLDCY